MFAPVDNVVIEVKDLDDDPNGMKIRTFVVLDYYPPGAWNPEIILDNQPILCHWSRVSRGECSKCGATIWHPYNTSPAWSAYGAVTGAFYKPVPVVGRPTQIPLI